MLFLMTTLIPYFYDNADSFFTTTVDIFNDNRDNRNNGKNGRNCGCHEVTHNRDNFSV